MLKHSQKLLMALSILFCFFSLSASQSMVAHWKFDEGTGDSAYDLTGNGNHFKLLNGVAWVNGLNGKALDFDGIDDGGLCVDKPGQTGMSALTIESVLWLDKQPAVGEWGPVIGKWGPGSSEDDAWALDIDRSSPFGGHGVVVGGSDNHIFGQTPVPLQQWVHLVFTYDGSKMVLYVNGNKVDTNLVSSVGLIQDSDTEIRLGHNVDPHFFDGKIDEIALYNYALTAQSVKSKYEALFHINTHVIADWNFNEGAGDSAYDLSGNGNHFKLLNGVQWVQSKNGNALLFDGIDDKGLCPDLPCQTGMNALTIESVIWIEQHAATKWGPVIGKWGPGSSEDDAWALDVDRASPYGGHGVVVGSSTQHINGKAPLPIQKWIHLVFTWDGTKMALYLDGKKVDSTTVSSIGAIQNSNTEIRLGHNVDPHFFNGTIDQITLYDYALPPDIVYANFMKYVGPSHEINIGMKTHYAKAGDDVWVPVYLTNFEDTVFISSIELSINIDTSVVQFVTVSKDSGIAKNWTLAHNPLGDSIKISMGGVGQTIKYGEGELIRCLYKVKPTVVNGAFSDLILSDVLVDEGNNVHHTTTSGKIMINNVTVVYGDVSGNKEVTAYDAAGIVQYVMGILTLPDPHYPNFTLQVADVSGDQLITSYDAALVFLYSVGLLHKFPVESGIKKDRIVRSYYYESYPNSTFKLVKSSSSTASTVYYDLTAINVKGAISSDIEIKYNPAKILVEQGGTITTNEHVNIESTLDKVSKIIRISITATDDFDADTEIKLATIEAPVPDTSSLKDALLFVKALIDEENVKYLIPSISTDNGDNGSKVFSYRNNIIANSAGLVIYNFEKKPLTAEIYDMRGKRLLYNEFSSSNDIIKINTMRFAPGLYIYRIKCGSTIIAKTYLINR